MDRQRRIREEQVITHYMGGNKAFKFMDSSSVPCLRIAARTNSGRVYVLRIELQNFPNAKPNAYVECMLKDYRGDDMDGASSSNHTLSAHENGWTQICHYHPDAWHPNFSLWMVYMRCMVWLNLYEYSLIVGKPIDHFLPGHMSGDYESE